ncbi:MAG: hypothetical protein COA44_13115 [Arcobacter sp.]|nr:MAG: hypothetical protein COA44_13115 [Arcobacter sp.]
MLITHDPSEYIKGLQQLLISDKKRISFLFGAGSSMAKKNTDSLTVPSVHPLTNDIVDNLSETPKYKVLFDELKEELTENFNIETILSNFEQKIGVIGKSTLNGLNKEELDSLIEKYKEKIQEKISIHTEFTYEKAKSMVQVDFARWIGQVDRKFPIEIFTTNYDYLFELGLEYCNIPYYDGFSGSYKPFFNSESIEDMNFLPNQTKLWKIHGSLGWQIEEKTKKIIRTESSGKDILIYPSILKYNNSKKQPYESLMDRLSNFLKSDDSILIACGYSFGDEHINARIETALNTSTTAHVVFLYYDKYWCDTDSKYKFRLSEEDSLYKAAIANSKMSVYGIRGAVIGGKYGEWKLKNEPDKDASVNIDLYFDEDFDDSKEIGSQEVGSEGWSGKGDFTITDFSKLVNFLSSLMPINEIRSWSKNAK